MAISEFYASTVVSVRVDFRIAAFRCAPVEITNALGVEPDEARSEGESWFNRFGGVSTTPTSSWVVSSKSQSKDVNDHFRELFKLLDLRNRSLPRDWGEVSFGVVWKGNYLYAGSGPFYEADVLEGIAAAGAALYQDIYQIDQDDGEIETESECRRLPKSAITGRGT